MNIDQIRHEMAEDGMTMTAEEAGVLTARQQVGEAIRLLEKARLTLPPAPRNLLGRPGTPDLGRKSRIAINEAIEELTEYQAAIVVAVSHA